MCVKQFFGYNCGHCSIPDLMPCPLAASNPYYPTCAYPAERPIFTDAYCHPCSRIVWNTKVLHEEEQHRNRHLKGECVCEIKFQGDERAKWSRDGVAIQTHEGTSAGQDPVHLAIHGGTTTLAGTTGGLYQGFAHQEAPQVPSELHGYLGYVKRKDVIAVGANQSYAMTVGMHGNQGQLMKGEVGAGMKWHPYSAPTAEPSKPHDPSPHRNKTKTADNAESPAKESEVEPEDSGDTGGDEEVQQPAVVSSGTEGQNST